MIHPKRAGAAFANMLRIAGQRPLWAILSLIALPFRIWKDLFGYLVIVIIITYVVGMGGAFALKDNGYAQDSWPAFALIAVMFLMIAFVSYRFITDPIIHHFGTIEEDDTHGSARFALDKEVAPLTRSASGLLIGRDAKTGKLLRYDGPSHLLTMAPTRTGKGVGAVIPNLLTANRSVICIDPKGENARVTRHARQAFGPVHVLDPFGVTGEISAAFNPLDAMDADSLDLADDANTLADALVHDEPGAAGEAHWNEEAKALIAGLILHVVAHQPRNRRTLSTVRGLLTLPPQTFQILLKEMQEAIAADGLIARAANRHLGKSDREAAGVLSSAQRHTHFLDSPRMTAVLGRSDFAFADLKARTATVFLVLPPDRLASYSRWLRLLVSQSLTDMARARPDATRGTAASGTTATGSVLYLLDEFAALGPLAPVERAMGLMAGYGVQLWPILQDIHQLRATYGQRAGTFLSNAGVLQVFGVNDNDSARLVSDLLGQGTVVFQTMARALDSEKSGLSTSEHHTGRSLLTPDEVRSMPQSAQLLFLAGQRPIVAGKLRYYADAEFQGKFAAAG